MPSLAYKTVGSYGEIAPLIEGRYNEPEINGRFTHQSFETEYDAVYDALVGALEAVGDVDEPAGGGDFRMSRYVTLVRSITIGVASERAMCAATLEAIAGVLRRCRIAYVACLDLHPSYVCICRDGSVLGYGDASVLTKFGFPG
jgi:hypothetical protein